MLDAFKVEVVVAVAVAGDKYGEVVCCLSSANMKCCFRAPGLGVDCLPFIVDFQCSEISSTE